MRKAPIPLALLVALPLCAAVKLERHAGRIDVTIDGKPFTALYTVGTNKPYLYPLRAASGTVVTRGYPADASKGETTDHPHQKGLWFTHGVVNGYNYWANEPSQMAPETGRVVLRRIVAVENGEKAGSMKLVFDWLDPQGKPILTEERTTVFRSGPELRVMDFDFVLSPQTTVIFQDSTEGFFAVRLAAGLEEPSPKSPATPKRTGKMVNSEGKETEAECWGERAKWIDYAGELAGERLGVAIFDHPENPRHPTGWHSRGYGLFAANPFGAQHFYADKVKKGRIGPGVPPPPSGDLAAEPGKPLRFRYRVVIHPGNHRDAGIARLYEAYAAGS